jgi:HAD superfamily hydrolase (TIGR01450 family)
MIKAIAFDLDGTIYYGNQIIEGAIETIEYLKNKGLKIFYFTNNSTKTREQIYSKLTNMGLTLSIDSVYTSAYATAVFCVENQINGVYCIGSNGLISELIEQDIQVNSDDIKAVVIGLDLDINYEKLSQALFFLQKGCRLIICNQDKNYPIENGVLKPGCGSMVGAILGAYDKQIDFEVGKPNTYMIELLSKAHHLTKDNILVVGDSLESDIEMARRYGCQSVLVNEKNDLNQLRNYF